MREALSFLLLCAAPAAPAQDSGDKGLLFLQSLDQRVADISWRIISANSSLCARHISGLGLGLHNLAQYAPPYRASAIDSFGFGDGLPAVLAVAKGSPADAAGIRIGDRIASIDGEPVTPSIPKGSAREDYTPVGALMARLEQLPTDRDVPLDIRRGKAMLAITVRPLSVCRSRVEVVPSANINASSDGLIVQLYGKLALWTRNDDELAIVMAHEIAHNLLDHNARIDRERIGTGILASLGGDGRKMRDMERQADRYGLYLAAQASYDYRKAPAFWRRLSNTTGLGAIWATTHPNAGDRAHFNEQVVTEIEAKVRSHAALRPDG